MKEYAVPVTVMTAGSTIAAAHTRVVVGLGREDCNR